MSSLNVPFLVFLLGVMAPAGADDANSADQGAIDLSHWSGRPSSTGFQPPVKISTDSQSQEPGKPYLTMTTDGNLGSGLLLPPSVRTKIGNPYRVSFWLKTSGTAQITYRITDLSGHESNEAKPTWHAAPPSMNSWTKVEDLFFPISSLAGLEIAAGEKHTSTNLSISDPRMFPVSLDADSGASLDFSAIPEDWHGRPSDKGNVPDTMLAANGDSADVGKTSLSIQTDGKLGCGFLLDPVVKVSAGSKYLLTFWVKTPTSIPLSFRISGTGDRAYGDTSGTWHTASSSSGQWVKSEFPFVSVSSYVGVEIAAGAAHTPCRFSIAGVSIAPQ